MKKLLCILAVLALLITSLPSCSKKETAYELYSNAAEAILQSESGYVCATTVVELLSGTDQSVQSKAVNAIDFRFLGNDRSIRQGKKDGEAFNKQIDYAYIDGVLYMEKGVFGNSKWKYECTQDEIADVSKININMDFALTLPELDKDAFKDVKIMTDGSNRKITVRVPQSKLTHWMTAITGAAEVEESEEALELTLVLDAEGTLKEAYLRFQITHGKQTVKVDLALSYADFGARKPIETTSPIESYETLKITLP